MADDADISQQAVDAEIDAAQRRTASAISKRGTQVCLGCGEELILAAERRPHGQPDACRVR